MKISPQLRTSNGAPGSSDLRRLEVAADLLPRTHWNVNISYYRDHTSDIGTSVVLTQLHLYL